MYNGLEVINGNAIAFEKAHGASMLHWPIA
jgi:hypothetical protein